MSRPYAPQEGVRKPLWLRILSTVWPVIPFTIIALAMGLFLFIVVFHGGVYFAGKCTQPAGITYVNSLAQEPEKWRAQGRSLQFTPWGNPDDFRDEITIDQSYPEWTDTVREFHLSNNCKYAIWKLSRPMVKARDLQPLELYLIDIPKR